MKTESYVNVKKYKFHGGISDRLFNFMMEKREFLKIIIHK